MNDLWSKKYRRQILLVDSARDAMGMALVSLGYSMNTTSSIKLHLAQTKLNSLGPNIKAIISDEMKMYLVQNEAAIGVTWSGEAYEMMEQNPHLHYVVPKQGSNLWFDNFVIPKLYKIKKLHLSLLILCLNLKMQRKMRNMLDMQPQIPQPKNYCRKKLEMTGSFILLKVR